EERRRYADEKRARMAARAGRPGGGRGGHGAGSRGHAGGRPGGGPRHGRGGREPEGTRIPSPEPKYILPRLPGPGHAPDHRELVDLVAERFGLTFTQRQALPAHFTLKYHFATSHIEQVETLLEDFAGRHPAAPVTVGGFGHFFEDVVFVEVALSPAAQSILHPLLPAPPPLAS